MDPWVTEPDEDPFTWFMLLLLTSPWLIWGRVPGVGLAGRVRRLCSSGYVMASHRSVEPDAWYWAVGVRGWVLFKQVTFVAGLLFWIVLISVL